MSVTSTIYSTSLVILFCLLSYISSAFFDSIGRQVEQINRKNDRSRYQSLDEALLLGIKRRHSLAIDVVACLNECFGWNLLLTISFLFVNIINSSFYIFGEEGGMNITDLSFGLTSTVHLLALCLSADLITRQVNTFIRGQEERAHNKLKMFLAAGIDEGDTEASIKFEHRPGTAGTGNF